MKKVTVQGQTVPYRTFKKEKNVEGGALKAPVEIQVKNHILHFSSLYRFTDSKRLCGGDLAHVHYLHIGTNWIPSQGILLYKDSSDIETLLLPITAKVVVGNEQYRFGLPSSGDILTFHPNGTLMSGVLSVPAFITTIYGRVLAQCISFYDDCSISTVVLYKDKILRVDGKEYTFKGNYGDYSPHYYSIKFAPKTGEIISGMLSDDEWIDFTR